MTYVECRKNDPPSHSYSVAGEPRTTKCCGEALWTFCHSSFGLPSSFGHSAFVVSHHLSHSPMTKSRLPKTAGTSLTMQPGRSAGRMLRFTNDGARIFNRYGTPPPLLLM